MSKRWASPSPWTAGERQARLECYQAFAVMYPGATPAEIGKLVEQHWKEHLRKPLDA